METGVLQRFVGRAKELWGTPLGKILTLGIGSLLVAVIAYGLLTREPPMAFLGTFPPQRAAEVVAKLREKKIEFQQTGSGYTIEVRQEDLNTARLALAEAGLGEDVAWDSVPWGGQTSWNSTDRDKRISYKQLVEEELSRAIRTMSKVQNAKVIIALSEQALYARDVKPPKASVIIEPKRNEQLSVDEVKGIMMLVSSAVDGLTEENVVVMDSVRNRVISDLGVTEDSVSATGAWNIQSAYQKDWEKRLTERLEQVFGPGSVSVIVSVDLDWDKLRTEALTYSDETPLSTQEIRKSTEGSGGQSGQPAGIDANTPDAPTYRGSEGSGGTFSSEESSKIINYLVSEERRVEEKLPGGLNEISVAVFVDETKVQPTQVDMVRNMVEAAVGSKAGRVLVTAMRFDSTLGDVVGEQPVITVEAPPNYVLYGVIAGAALAAIIFATVAARRRRQALLVQQEQFDHAMDDLSLADVAASLDDAMPIRVPTTLEELAQMPPEEVALLGDEFLERLGVDPVKLRVKERVERLAKQNPEAVASLLKTWIAEE